MELRQVEYVVAAVDARTFTGAAAALHVSQPSLSQGIARLEAELGVELFQRVGRRVTLTSAGEAFVDPARQLLRDAAVIHDSVRAAAGLETGQLDIVALPTLAADPLAAIVGSFRRAYPGVAVHIAEPETADGVAQRVWDGRAEIGLAELPVLREELVSEPLLDQDLVVILPPGHQTGDMTIEQLAKSPLVATPPGTSTRRLLTDAFEAAGVAPTIAVETGQREAIVPLVLAGAGVAVLPRALGTIAATHGAVVVFLKPPLRRTIGLVHRLGALSPAAARFRDMARDLAGQPDGHAT